jgi:hypothetical protein
MSHFNGINMLSAVQMTSIQCWVLAVRMVLAQNWANRVRKQFLADHQVDSDSVKAL